MARFMEAKTGAGPFAQLAGVVVDIVGIANLVEQAGRVVGRVGAAGLLMQQEETQGAGP
jgi:hypothetical protein